MGREVKRVRMDFDFPIGKSIVDHHYNLHLAKCLKGPDEDHEDDCGYVFDAYESDIAGEGWQLWQTVSGGPISPVFVTSQELVNWMTQPDLDPKHAGRFQPWAQGWNREDAEAIVKMVDIPSMIVCGGRVLSPAEMLPKVPDAVLKIKE